jgi:hypothetical protein
MRSSQLTLCTGAVLAAVLFPAPTALAAVVENEESHGSVTVTPSTIAAGGEVNLEVSVCGNKKAVGTSEAFAWPAELHPGSDGGLSGKARIRSDASGRDYSIQVRCEDGPGSASGNVTVVHHRVDPTAPVRAGGGGTALAARSAAESDGPGTPHTLIGLGLAGIAAVAIAARSVRRRRSGTPAD